MKLVQYYNKASTLTTQLGIETPHGLINVAKLSNYFNKNKEYTMESVIKNSDKQLRELNDLIKQLDSSEIEVETFIERKEQVAFLPVVQNPEKIICVGMNYLAHVKEMDGEIPLNPVLYNKFNNTLAAHKQEIPLPPVARQVDYSAELVVVIGQEMKNVQKEDVFDYIFGYTIGNNFSERKVQRKSSQWMLGKTLDYFAPIGPNIVTKDEISNLDNLYVTLKVNNEIVQNGNTKDMIFDIPSILSYLSKHLTLKPGDLIFTGTPKGVILAKPADEQNWLSQNDLVEATISNIGTLRNQIK
ncbi:fumarylacetoacetate hydrolase family protein [Marinilactibacillus psychrotolerans]|uniref:Fumarylacetoacetate hydrolase family protein n=2 Tax=Marinilactibacillus psychrotolerans TaxID=191770 RepID=A0A5R9C6V4_9LACT|nr:fumarylacetoacetate hydrolase family protein [Marinilactibacillus psychrotolerans]TLQ08867.1 fumarylacetoacetate hydrolase family protein [Marinilactibacillus psychrotolerans]GEQ33316.1 fumarylacetoacetate hydrolase [Marinilactibacillus psychrotolerans]SJN36012.1 Fumarylacetoacetate hydrolase family protein [Marinilactibacillus psychrotolerans 42ea]